MHGSKYGKDWLAGENEICNAHQLSLWESRAFRPGEGNQLREYFEFVHEKKPHPAANASDLPKGEVKSGVAYKLMLAFR